MNGILFILQLTLGLGGFSFVRFCSSVSSASDVASDFIDVVEDFIDVVDVFTTLRGLGLGGYKKFEMYPWITDCQKGYEIESSLRKHSE